MPNYCLNELIINGENDELEKFYQENKTNESELSFEKSVPNNDWSTKWDAGEVTINKYDGEYQYNFETAWSPPERWLKKVAKQYNNLNFYITASEEGCDFHIEIDYENGIRTRLFEETYENYFCREYDIDFRCDVLLDYIKDKPELKRKVLDINNDLTDLADEDPELEDVLGEFCYSGFCGKLQKMVINKYNIWRKYWIKWRIIYLKRLSEKQTNKTFYDLTVHEFKLRIRDKSLGI